MLAALSAFVMLALGAVQASGDMDQDVFDGWNEDNREAALASFEATDWEALADQLILDGKISKGI